MITKVDLSRNAEKDLIRVPQYIAVKLFKWTEDVEERGLEEVRKVQSYHDEPLKGKREGQRSIRLSKSYRAIYRILKDEIEFVRIEEVNKHDY